MFVLYRLCLLLSSRKDEEGADVLLKYSPVLLYLSLDALVKTQRDDVRLNCLGLLLWLRKRLHHPSELHNSLWFLLELLATMASVGLHWSEV